MMSIGSFQVPSNIIAKPTCNVYNLGGPPLTGLTVSRGQVTNYLMDVPKTEKKIKTDMKYRIKPSKLEI